MLKHIVGAVVGAAGAAAVSHAGAVDDQPYELLRGDIDGRPMVAIVNLNGIAVAVELKEERAQIVRGLAAGAILSDLREIAGLHAEGGHRMDSGGIHSEVRVDGKRLVGRASRSETRTVIENLEQLNEQQKRELIGLLGLE